MNEERRQRIVKLAMRKARADLHFRCSGMQNIAGVTLERLQDIHADYALAEAEMLEAGCQLAAAVEGP